ncbi:disrupted in schizophrenia 1 protein [Talpa occidentalis]|uniref:disrupted in schizophrenia 1 protein n=1 Tax=Talpa occidentalis TaxID=50954 RepID=UPI0023FA07E2|nr:disrupted in schizophrenia 1 protein [Talpa occidentalis]
MPGGGPQSAPARGSGALRSGNQDCAAPAASFRRRRLARRPGYMRSTAGPQIGFLAPAVGTPFWPQGEVCSEKSESRTAQCALDSGSQWQGPSAGSPVPKGTTASILTSLGHLRLALSPVRGATGLFGIQLRAAAKLPNRITRSCGPGNISCQGELPSMDSAEPPDLSWDAACSEGARGTWTKGCLASEEVSSDSCSLASGLKAPSAPEGCQDAFTSSFSFIRLSLGSAGERGEAEGCPPSREAKAPCQSLEETEAMAADLERPHADLRLLSLSCSLKTAQGPEHCVQAAGGSPSLACEKLALLATDTASSCFQGNILGDALPSDLLLRKCESVLLDCLLSHRRQLEVKSLRLNLQKLQEKAIEDDDFDKAEMLKQKLEELEKEKSDLQFQLPSRQPALRSLLHQLGAQAQAALHRALQVGSDSPQTTLRTELKPLVPTAQDHLHVAITRRDWLLQEKQQLQREIEALQARMSVLEAKDHRLRKEIDELEQLLPWQGCDLTPLVGRLSLGELQEVSKDLQDTLALANQIPLRAEPPETIKSLQDRIKSLNLSLKEITAKVCMSEELCSTLRKKVNDIETQLPGLLEAKMLAISGNHFCMAKELTEDITSLTSEREGLKGLLNKLLVLSSRNVKKLGSIREDYDRLRRELDHGETAYETSVKEKTMKYMAVLEDKLHSCKCPLLGKVWEADLEACQLFIQSLQLQEGRDNQSADDEKQVDDLGGAIPPRLHCEHERKTPLEALEEWKAHLTTSPHCAITEQKEESYIFSAELGEKCEAIGKKLLYLEDQLHTAIHSHDEELIHILSSCRLKTCQDIL